MATLERNVDTELISIVERAAEFHGHLGPFLVIGVRIGLIGLRESGIENNDGNLCITAMLKNSIPFSCTIDGIQVSTKCTLGNRKLKLIDSSGIAAEFELQHGGKVTVAVNPATFNRLKQKLLSKNVSPEDTRKLAWMVASMPEEELFIIRSK